MPARTKRVCSKCRKVVPPGPCETCTAARKAQIDADRPTAAGRGYNAQWQRTRASYLDDHPYCECRVCTALPEWQRPLANEVHHKDGRGPLGPRGHDPSNLQAMTHECHSRTTNEEQGGFGRPLKRHNP